MKVHLRQKTISNNRKSLYLEFYEAGNRKFEMLGLYIFDKKRLTQIEKDHNKQILNTAEAIRSQRIIEHKNNEFGFVNKKINNSFTKYYKNIAYKKGNNYITAYKSFNNFLNQKEISFKQIDTKLLNNYREDLFQIHTGVTPKIYITALKYVIKQAYNEGIYTQNPIKNFNSVKATPQKRTYLTFEDLKKLKKTETDNDIKNAFLFACYCGMRISDIKKLKYNDINNNQIEIQQQKTNETVYIPINEYAYEYIEKEKIGNNELNQ